MMVERLMVVVVWLAVMGLALSVSAQTRPVTTVSEADVQKLEAAADYIGSGEIDKGLAIYKAMIEQDASDLVYWQYGEALSKVGRLEDARAAFEAGLAAPEAETDEIDIESEIRRKLAAVEAQIEARRVRIEPPVSELPDVGVVFGEQEVGSGAWPRPGPLTLMGIGVAGLAVGGVGLFLVRELEDEVVQLGHEDVIYSAQDARLRDRARRLHITEGVGFTVGAVSLLSGLVWWVLDEPAPKAVTGKVEARPLLGVGFVGAGLNIALE